MSARFEARRTRSGRVVAVGAPADLEAALHERVELIAPDAAQTATAVLVGIGRTWVDPHTGRPQAYGYIAAETLEQTSLGAA